MLLCFSQLHEFSLVTGSFTLLNSMNYVLHDSIVFQLANHVVDSAALESLADSSCIHILSIY